MILTGRASTSHLADGDGVVNDVRAARLSDGGPLPALAYALLVVLSEVAHIRSQSTAAHRVLRVIHRRIR
jgi:hypothetical protein